MLGVTESRSGLVPRYRFQWEHIPESLLTELAVAAGATGEDPAGELRLAYGARPKERFVHDLWPTLREVWLARDESARAAVIDALRRAGVGRSLRAQREPVDAMEFLRSVRNAKSMRTIVLAAFHELGESDSAVDPVPRRVADRGLTPRSRAWEPYSMTLAQTLGALSDGQYLVLECKDRPGFVQFVVHGVHGLRAELVSNYYLPAEAQLTPESIEAVTALGWHPPTGSPEESTPEQDPDGSANFFRDWPLPVPFIEVARLAVDSLVEVMAVPHPRYLRYQAFTGGGSAILLPALGERAPAAGESTFDVADESLGAEQVAQRVLEILRHASGDDELEPDDEGDVALQFGSSVVFVRVFGDPPIVRIYSPALGQVPDDPKITDVVNDLNRDSAFTKWLAIDDTIIAVMDLFGSPLNEASVLQACSVVGNSADDEDDALQQMFGGKTFFGEYVRPKLPPSTGGYL